MQITVRDVKDENVEEITTFSTFITSKGRTEENRIVSKTYRVGEEKKTYHNVMITGTI